MSTEENKMISRRFSEEIFNEKQLDRADDIFIQDYVDHSPSPGQAAGLEGAKQKWSMYIAAFPDMRVPIEDMVAEGDKVGVRWTLEGTHRGELMGIPPTGKRIQMNGISILRLAGEKIAEQWEQTDRLGLMQQLGVIRPPGRLEVSVTPSLLTTPSGPVHSRGANMFTEDNKAAERRFYEEVWKNRNLGAVDELVARDVVEHNPSFPGQAPGLEGFRQFVDTLLSSFSEVQITIGDLIAEGDKVVVRWAARGRHSSEFMRIPLTNKQVTATGIDICRYEGGKRIETWRQWDILGFMQQLGAIPSPQPTS